MIKVVAVLKRRPGLAVADFRAHWLNEHTALVRRLPGLRRYVQSHTLDGGYRRGEPAPYKAEGRLFTFALDAEASLAVIEGIARPPLTPVPFEADAQQIARGADLFGNRCSMCHGVAAVSAGTIADLRYSQPATLASLEQIVRDGAFLGLGMPRFEWFTDTDIADLRAFILAQRAELIAAESDL